MGELQLKFKGTPGPWRWELNENAKRLQLCGGKRPYDIIVMDFVRYGMHGAAPRFNSEIKEGMNIMYRAEKFSVIVPGREHHAHWFKSLDHPDAVLIQNAPRLLEVGMKLLALSESLPVVADIDGLMHFSSIIELIDVDLKAILVETCEG